MLTSLFNTNFRRVKNSTNIPKKTVFCEDSISTHYYYKDSNGYILDPYNYFQVFNSHGNCFLYALYFAYLDDKLPSTNILINVSNLLTKENGILLPKKTNTNSIQNFYKYYVHNDFKIINWIIDGINNTHNLFTLYTNTWETLTIKNKNKYEISSKLVDYSFENFFTEFKSLAHDIKFTYTMTYDQFKYSSIPRIINLTKYIKKDEYNDITYGGKKK